MCVYVCACKVFRCSLTYNYRRVMASKLQAAIVHITRAHHCTLLSSFCNIIRISSLHLITCVARLMAWVFVVNEPQPFVICRCNRITSSLLLAPHCSLNTALNSFLLSLLLLSLLLLLLQQLTMMTKTTTLVHYTYSSLVYICLTLLI